MLHEMGHVLGCSGLTSTDVEVEDGIYDVNANLTNGNEFGLYQKGTDAYHLQAVGTLMRSGIGSSRRVLPSAADVLAIAAGPNWTQIDLPRKDFFPGGTSDWNTSGNWGGGMRPGLGDDAFVRHPGRWCLSQVGIRSQLREVGQQDWIGERGQRWVVR